MSPRQPVPDSLRIATWNVNSLRARTDAVARLLTRALPDVLCLQDKKASRVSSATAQMLADLGYEIIHVGAGAYNGVAIASLHPMDDVRMSGGFDDEDLDRDFFFSSRRRHTRCGRDWSSDVCSSDLNPTQNMPPIEHILPELKQTLNEGTTALLQAPPGAGKTTRVPLALLDAPWRENRKILDRKSVV